MLEYSTLIELLDDANRRFAKEPLFGVKDGTSWRWTTYGEFHRQTSILRTGLKALGLSRGDRIALICDNSVEWALTAFAAYGLGAALVPMYEAQRDKEWIYILKDCGAKIVVCGTQAIADKLAAAKAELPALQHRLVVRDGERHVAAMLAKNESTEATAPDPEDAANFIYTSGTTGNPKGVILSHKNFASNVSGAHTILSIEPGDRSLSFLPWAHAFGQTGELYTLMTFGASMALNDRIDKLIDNLAEVRPTVLVSVPAIFKRIYEAVHKKMEETGGVTKALFYAALANEKTRREINARGQTSLVVYAQHKVFDKLVFSKVRDRFGGRLRFAVSGGAAMQREVGEFIDALGIIVLEGYGLTETAPVVACNQENKRKLGTVGPILPGVRVEISEPGEDGTGEIIVHGPNVMKGYHQLPEENEKVFTADHGFRTGDLGVIDSEGFLRITGRIKEQYKLENGKYVAPAPLEEALKLSPMVANAIVWGDNKPYNVALIVVNMANAKDWAKHNGVGENDLVKNEKFVAYMNSEVQVRAKAFKGYETVKKLLLIDEDFTTENGMLTPKMSVKRRVVLQKYGDALNALYR